MAKETERLSAAIREVQVHLRVPVIASHTTQQLKRMAHASLSECTKLAASLVRTVPRLSTPLIQSRMPVRRLSIQRRPRHSTTVTLFSLARPGLPSAPAVSGASGAGPSTANRTRETTGCPEAAQITLSSRHYASTYNVELDQRLLQRRTVSKRSCKRIRLELKPTWM